MNKKPVNVVGYFPGGARYGLISIIFARHVEEALGEPLANFLQSGSIGSSVGSITASIVATEIPIIELEGMFTREVGKFIPYDECHYHKQIKAFASKVIINKANSIFRRNEIEHETHLYSTDRMKRVLSKCFGNATFGDLENDLIITSHAISGDNQGPYDFYRINHNNLKPDSPLSIENETLDVSIVDAILASTACATVFPSHHIPTTNAHHIDIALVDNGITQMTKLALSQKNGLGMGLVEFGSFLSVAKSSAKDYNKLGIVEMTIEQTMLTQFGIHSKMSSREHFRTLLGHKNYHILELSGSHLDKNLFDHFDMLDSRPEEIRRMVESAEDYIRSHQNEILQVADFLSENRTAHEIRSMEQQAPIVSIVKSLKPKKQRSWANRLSRVVSMLSL